MTKCTSPGGWHEWFISIADRFECANCAERMSFKHGRELIRAAETLLPMLYQMNNKDNYYATFAAFGDSVPQWIYDLAADGRK